MEGNSRAGSNASYAVIPIFNVRGGTGLFFNVSPQAPGERWGIPLDWGLGIPGVGDWGFRGFS